jgi:hypothetical protein
MRKLMVLKITKNNFADFYFFIYSFDAMDGRVWVLLLIGAGLFLAMSSFSPANGMYDFDSLATTYGADNVAPIQNLYNILVNSAFTPLQVELLLSQALHETGLFTASPNWDNVNANNLAGITPHGSFGTTPSGNYAAYPDLSTFVSDWTGPAVLNKGSFPLQATDVQDFAARLKSNGYFTDNLSTYSADLQQWFNVLQSAQLQPA